MSEEAKKKFTFKILLVYIEDRHVYDDEYDARTRLAALKHIQESVKYARFPIYFSLLENVRMHTSFNH